jgi:hypothetical protein
MSLFNRKPLTPDEKDLVRELYSRSQKNPNLLSQDDAAIVNELYRRLDAEDPVRTALDKSMSGEISDRKALEYANKYGYDKPTRKLYKKIKGLGTEPEVETPRRERPKSPEAMNTPSNMSVEKVLQEDKVKQDIQKEIDEAKERKRTQYTQIFGVDPNKDKVTAFRNWWNKTKQDPEKLDKYVQRYQTETDMYRAFEKSLEEGTLEKQFDIEVPKPKPEFDKSLIQPTSMQAESTATAQEGLRTDLKIGPQYTASDAVKDMLKNPAKYLPYGGFVEAGNIGRIYLLAQEFDKNPDNLSDAEMKELTDWVEYANFQETATWGAQLVETIAQMPGFAAELYTSGGLLKVGTKAAIDAAEFGLKKYLKEGLKDKIERHLKKSTTKRIVTSTAEKVAITGIGTTISGDVDKNIIQNLMPGYEFKDGEIEKIYNGMDQLSAERQGFWSTAIEFGSEQLGSGPAKFWKWVKKTKYGKKAGDGFIKAYRKLGLPEKEAVMNSAVIKAFKKANPMASDSDIKKVFEQLGYHGVLEEMYEERLGDVSRAVLKKLTEEGVVEGFDNPNWELKMPTKDQLALELVAFTVPGVAMRVAQKGKEISKERKFKKKAPKIQKDIEASEKIEEESKEEYEAIEKKIEDEGTKALSKKKKRRLKKLQSLDKLSDKQQKELTNLENEKRILGYASLDKEEQDKRTEIVDNRIKLDTNKTLKQIIIDNPEIADEVDLSEVNLDEEVTKTRKELEDEYGPDFVTGEGMDKDSDEFKVMGYTVLANSKLKLGLKKGSTFDTVLEEYYGLIRRGGLTEEQRETYNEHYEKYKTDENYRIEINEFINDMHEKMGLEKPIADTSQILSSDKLFDKEGKSYEYKAGEQKQDIADKVYEYVGKMFNKVFGRTDKSDEMKEVYKQVQKRKLKISSKKAQKQAEREERRAERESKKKVKETKKIEKKRKRLKPDPTIEQEEEFDTEDYDVIPDPKSPDLPKNIKSRKKEAKKVKEKKKIFNFIKNRTKKVQAKKIEKLSPVAIREVKAKIERAPEVNIPDDQREPLEILRAVLGNEQFTELTGIPSGPIANLDKIDPKIIPALTKKFPEYMSSLEKIDIIDLIPEEEQNKIINQVSKVVGKKTIEPIRLKKLKPKKIPTKKKDISYQLSVLDVSKKLANPKEVTEEDKVNVAVQQGIKEVITAIEESDEGIIHESLKWYGTRFEKTLDLAGEEVRLDTPEDDLFLTTVIGIQSQGAEVEAQYNTAINSYKYYDENGTFDYRTSPNTGKPVVYSQNQKGKDVIVGGVQPGALLINHKKLESLIGKFGKEKAMNWLITKHTGKEIQEVLESVGLKKPAHIKVGGEYYGSRIFGRKIGNFISNLAGKSDVATYDRWWVRTWNRWLGTPTRMEKGEEKVQESPRGNIEEDLMNEAIDNIAKLLTEATGYKFTPPAVQAVLWYYEKELYIKNDARVPEGLDYLGAAESRAKEKGYATTPTGTKRDRRVTEQRIAKEKRDTASLKKGIKKTGKKARQKAPQVSYQLTPTQKEFFKDTKVVDSKGNPKVVYHGTPYSFDIFKDTKDIGFHAGTIHHADTRIIKFEPEFLIPEVKNNILQYVEGGNIMPLYFNIKNPMYLPDLKTWSPIDVASSIKAEYGFKDVPRFLSSTSLKEQKKQIVNYIKSAGFDGIIYRNEFEGSLDLTIEDEIKYEKMLDENKLNTAKEEIQFLQELDTEIGIDDFYAGLSYIAFDTNQIKSATAMAEQPTKDPRISYQLEPTKPELFSPALRSIENLPQKSLKRQGLRNHFKRNNVPKAELDWLGVMEWARENYKPAESIPKEDIIEFIKQNQSEVIDVTLGEVADLPEGWNFQGDFVNGRPEYVSDNKKVSFNFFPNEYSVYFDSLSDVKKYSQKEYKKFQKENPSYPPPFPEKLINIGKEKPKFETLTMVGGENYKELLVRHPDGTFVEESHWDIPGIIVSLRLTTRYDSKGNKILFIEEIQSDWTKEARKLRTKEVNRLISKGMSKSEAEKKVPEDFGYVSKKTQAEYDKEIKEAKAKERKRRKELYDYIIKEDILSPSIADWSIFESIREAFDYANSPIIDSVTNRLKDKDIERFIKDFSLSFLVSLNKTQAKKIMKLWAQISTPSAIVEAGPPKGLQDTPYKDNWIRIGVKKAILHAVENNFDKIAVATPEQVADMFDVSKVISEIKYVPIDPNAKRSAMGYKRFNVRVLDKNNDIITDIPTYNTPEQLERYLGKGIVDKMLAGEGSQQLEGERGAIRQFEKSDNVLVLSGPNLRTKAQFVEDIYNSLANTLAKEGRRLDPKLKAGTTDIVIEPNDMMAELNRRNPIIPQDLKDKQKYEEVLTSKASMDNFVQEGKGIPITRKSIDLTDTLKDKVNKTGIPSFQLKPVGEPLDIYDDISNKDLKKFGKGERRRNRFIKHYETALIPVSTLLKRINPKIYNMLLRYQFKVGTEQNKAKQLVVDMEKFVRKMPKQDQAIFKLAMLNNDGATILSLIEKYDNKQNDFLASYKKIRETLDILRDRLIENGEDVGYIEDYLPRKVLSHDKLIEYMYGNRNAKAVIEKQIEAKEKDLERPLTQSEKAELINQLIRGYSYLKSKPSYLKGRKFDKITSDMIEFYEEPFIQLLNHMDRAIERIEQRTFLGFGENTDESIGEFVAGLMEQGINLTQEQQEDVFRIIKSYFDFKPTESYLSGIKTGAYGLLLGRFTNTITQVQDMVYSIYENGLGQHRTIENAVRYIFRLQRAKRKQLGIEAIGQEFKIDTKSKFNKLMDNSTNIILTGSGFKAMDGFGKSVLINSSIQKYKRKAQKNRLTKKDKAYLKSLFGKDYNDAIKDLKKKTSPSEYTDAELYIGYATILKYQPIGRTEVPLGYLENPNVGRMFYMLKTFAIKQLNVLRDDGLDIITGKQKGNKLKATRDMIYLTFLIVLAGAGGDELKDWIKQRKSTLEDKVIDNFLKLLLINKYFTDKIRRESAYKGTFKSILENGIDAVISFPPITVAVELVDAMWVAIMKEEEDKKKSKGARYIPWIGDVLYYRRDVEQLIEKEIPSLSGIGGRGRDDYVERSLNAIYKMAKDRQLTEDELRIYKELIDDAKKYPQTKTVKGKSKRAIDVDKHRKMYKSENKKFKKLSPRDFIKKNPFISTEFPTIKKALK